MNKENSNSSGSGIAIGIGLGVAFGAIVGVLTDNIGLWLPIGVAIGAGMGVAINSAMIGQSDDSASKDENSN